MPDPLSVQLAKIAAHESWAKTKDRNARTHPGRQAAWRKLVDSIDPDGEMSDDDRQKAIENAISAHYRRLALLSAEARRRKAPGVGE